MSAGVASAGAALVTSKFGVAGTLLGAALTAMIITGGSAILKAYLETVTGHVRKVPGRFRERRKAGRYAEPSTLPGRPDLLNNFAGRMRAALEWFSHLPLMTRRSILIKGLIAAAVAFVIGMGAVYAFEKVIGNSLSCGVWANCPKGATPGIHLGGGDGTGAGSTLAGGSPKQTSSGTDGGGFGSNQGGPLQRQHPLQPQNPGYQPPARQQNPSDSNVAPPDQSAAPGVPDSPVEEPETPGVGNQAPEQPAPDDGQAIPPQDNVPVGAQSAPAQ
jgi:hypothetical protein